MASMAEVCQGLMGPCFDLSGGDQFRVRLRKSQGLSIP